MRVYKSFVLVSILLLSSLVVVSFLSPAAAGEKLPVCEDLKIAHVIFENRVDNVASPGVGSISFEWTPAEGAVWYRLKIWTMHVPVAEYLLKGDLGLVVPVSALEPTGIGDYGFEVIALDANGNPLCSSGGDNFYLESIYAPLPAPIEIEVGPEVCPAPGDASNEEECECNSGYNWFTTTKFPTCSNAAAVLWDVTPLVEGGTGDAVPELPGWNCPASYPTLSCSPFSFVRRCGLGGNTYTIEEPDGTRIPCP